MINSYVKLSDGTIIRSGVTEEVALASVSIHESCNTGSDLTLGSVCSTEVNISIINPEGMLSINAGDEFELYRNDKLVGIFTAEKPKRSSPNRTDVTGYDRIIKLDKDLTDWLSKLTEWPYSLDRFAQLVCNECGLYIDTAQLLNKEMPITQFSIAGVTGRQLMQWIGETGCCYIVADANGNVVPNWYQNVSTLMISHKEGPPVTITEKDGIISIDGSAVKVTDDDQGNVSVESLFLKATDDGLGNVGLHVLQPPTHYYYQNSLKFEDYVTESIGIVQIRLGSGENAYLWPENTDNVNSYIVSGNPILNGASTEIETALHIILLRLKELQYTPCSVTIPETLDFALGQITYVCDKNGKVFPICIMTKKTKGHRDTIECVGSYRRDSTAALNGNKTMEYIAQLAVDSQSQKDIFNKLTNNGKAQGVYLRDGLLYINASYIQSGTIAAEYIDVKGLKVDAAQITGVLDAERIDGSTLNITKGATITGWNVGDNVLSAGTAGTDNFIGLYSSYPSTSLTIGNVTNDNWRIVAGTKFGVTRDGLLSAADVDISGKITATGGKIAGWTIGDTSLTAGTFGTQGFIGLYTSYSTSENYRLVIGSKFKVNRDGAITATGGTIGGWSISSSTLSGSSAAGAVEISPLGVTGPYRDPDDGETRSGLITWYQILSAAMAWEG